WATFMLHFFRRHAPWSLRPSSVLAHLAEAALLASPLLAIGTVVLGARAARRGWRDGNTALLFLACMGFPPLAVMLLISSGEKAPAHHVAAAFVPLLILFVWWCQTLGPSRWFRPSVRVAQVCTMVAMAAFSTPALVPYGPARRIHAFL